MAKTQDDLMAAFAGESQANRKYTAFAEAAEKDGYRGTARLFRAAAEAETIHALTEFRVAGRVGDIKANLNAAIDGETHEYTEMYPEFEADAKAEGQKEAERAFTLAKEAEKVHARLYQTALDDINKGVNEDSDYYLCPICGYIEKGKAPESCPICKAKGSVFKKF
jgi:rubrerythrin